MPELDKPVWIRLDYRDDFEETFQVRITAVEQHMYDPRPTATYDVKLELGEQRTNMFVRHEAVAFIRKQALQALMDDMWRLGIRPQGEGTLGQLSAQQDHITSLKDVINGLLHILEDRMHPIYHINNNEAPPRGAVIADTYAENLRRQLAEMTDNANQRGGIPNVRNQGHP